MRHRQIPITFVNGHLCVMRGWDRALPDGWLVGAAPALPNHGVKKVFIIILHRDPTCVYYIVLHYILQFKTYIPIIYAKSLARVAARSVPTSPLMTTDPLITINTMFNRVLWTV